MDKVMIAMYLRLSNEDSDREKNGESNSISAQRTLLAGHIEELMRDQPYGIVEFCDDGYSGTDFNRPGVKAMLEAAKSGMIHMVIVKDFSRFGRDYLEVGRYLEYIFPILQVRFVSVNDGYDSTEKFGATGGMGVALKNLVYGLYSADLSKKVRSARDTRVRNGEFVGAFAPYGYRKDPKDRHKLLVDEDVAWVVRKIFRMAADGTSLAEITRQLNDAGTPTIGMYHGQKGDGYGDRQPHVKIKRWNAATVRSIIANEAYLGTLLWNRTRCGIDTDKKTVRQDRENWIIVENRYEALVSRELFDSANDRVSHGGVKGRKLKERNPFFICGHCGRVLQLGGKLKKRYFCKSRVQQTENDCRAVNVPQMDLEDAVLHQVRKLADVMLGQREGEKNQCRDERKAMLEKAVFNSQKEILHWKDAKLRLYEQYKAGSLSREGYLAQIEKGRMRLEELERSKREAQAELDSMQAASATEEIPEAALAELSVLESFDQGRLKVLVGRVIVYGEDSMEIVWKVENPFGTEIMV